MSKPQSESQSEPQTQTKRKIVPIEIINWYVRGTETEGFEFCGDVRDEQCQHYEFQRYRILAYNHDKSAVRLQSLEPPMPLDYEPTRDEIKLLIRKGIIDPVTRLRIQHIYEYALDWSRLDTHFKPRADKIRALLTRHSRAKVAH